MNCGAKISIINLSYLAYIAVEYYSYKDKILYGFMKVNEKRKPCIGMESESSDIKL